MHILFNIFSFKLLILYFSTKNIHQATSNLVWCIFLHILYCGIFFFPFLLSTQFLHFRSSFLFTLFKVLGMVQCFASLSFLPPLARFGLVTPIPVSIRVLGVEHPKNLLAQGRKATRQNIFPLCNCMLFQFLNFLLCNSFSTSLLN